jgi:S-DNA-T family DNA segregation ATPase FtsK/SpoIIIE
VALFAVSLLYLIALVSYTPDDPAWFFNSVSTSEPANFAGRVGAFGAELAFQLLGYSAFLIPLLLGFLGWHYFWCKTIEAEYTKLVGAALFVGATAALLALAFGALEPTGRHFPAGGWIGSSIASLFSIYLNRTGATILLLTLLALSVLLSTHVSLGHGVAALTQRIRGRHGLLERFANWRAERRRDKERREIVSKHVRKVGQDRAPEVANKAADAAARLKTARARPIAADADEDDDDMEEVAPRGRPGPAAASPAIRRAMPVPAPLPLEAAETAKAPAERRKGDYVLPPVTLLDAAKDQRKIDERDLMDAAKLLEEKCREFSVEGTVVQIHPGPVVTTYEFKPDAGVKYSRITGLADDLCLAMRAESVLIDRIPGKSTVGIQIPNPHRETITLRELLESDTFTRSTSRLTMALGKTIHGEPFVSDLSTMPHLLIAGSTGAGKSVSVNAMISSILFRCTPDEVRFIMIDPKRLELGMYEDIPHLLTPVVVDPKQASNALRWGVREMEERYKTLAKHGVRNIDQFNRNIKAAQAEKLTEGPDGEPLKTMPYIVVIIDELADLMLVAARDVEDAIMRLAQMARAAGIHLILATQRPSVDVLTGVIKANFPARISFQVSSKTDSRTILDANGAEQLLGRGDMLYLAPGTGRITRIHGAYVSETEIAATVGFIKSQAQAAYEWALEEADATGMRGGEDPERDDLYGKAIDLVATTGQASASFIQRRLRVGYPRAARMIEMMEEDQIVGPASGGKPREVLVRRAVPGGEEA